MKQAEFRPLLVTGAHRTGTTWVGRLLAAAPRVAYISEPLNVLHRPGVFDVPVPNWYAYVCDENAAAYLPAFRELLSFHYHLGSELGALRSARDLGRMGRDLGVFLSARVRHSAPLLKDPFAVFSVEWFARVLKCRIVVTVRHPAAFASGLKRLGWSFDFRDLLQQPLLLRDHLGPFQGAMLSGASQSVVEQAGLLWTMIYGALLNLRSTVPGLQIVRHEDLARAPVDRFRELYGALGLTFTARVERRIRDSSSARNPVELSPRSTHAVRMDSAASIHNWKRRLSAHEVAQVRRLTQDVADAYYSEESWN